MTYYYTTSPRSVLYNAAIGAKSPFELKLVAARYGLKISGVYLDKCKMSCWLPEHVQKILSMDYVYTRLKSGAFVEQ